MRSLVYRLMYPLNKVRWTFESQAWRGEYRDELDIAKSTARPGPLSVVLVMDHLKPRANAGKLVRTADAMGATEVRTVGMPFFNTRPAVESIRNIPVREDVTIDACFETLRRDGYTLFALEPERDIERRTYLDSALLPAKTAFIVGHETRGVPVRPGAMLERERRREHRALRVCATARSALIIRGYSSRCPTLARKASAKKARLVGR